MSPSAGALLIRLGLVHFQRENLLGREIDMLNLGWVWNTFRRAFTGTDEPPALLRLLRSGWQRWVRRQPVTGPRPPSPPPCGRMGTACCAGYRVEVAERAARHAARLLADADDRRAGDGAAYWYVDANLPPTASLPEETARDAVRAIRAILIDDEMGLNLSAPTLFWHNLRAELLMIGLGLFSFGVLGILIFLGNFSLVGGVLSATQLVGLSPLMVLAAGILPHGIFELPSVILAAASVMYLGVRMVTPLEGKTIGETLIITLADVLKILVAVCIPLLLLGAFIEANLTPHILVAAIGHSLDWQP